MKNFKTFEIYSLLVLSAILLFPFTSSAGYLTGDVHLNEVITPVCENYGGGDIETVFEVVNFNSVTNAKHVGNCGESFIMTVDDSDTGINDIYVDQFQIRFYLVYFGYLDFTNQVLGINTNFSVLEPLTSPVSGFQTMINEGDTVMQTATNQNMSASVAWAGDNLIKLFIGSGLSVLYYLRFWILALVIIFLIVFFYKKIKPNKV